jgi:xylulokinase
MASFPRGVSSSEVTVGIDIGTTSVKAVAASAEGKVVSSVRIPYSISFLGTEAIEHNARRAWRSAPVAALDRIGESLPAGCEVAAVGLAGMAPSMTAVGPRGAPLVPGLLYGERSAKGDSGLEAELAVNQLARTVARSPHASGYWPAQAVASKALGGEAAIDSAVGASMGNLLKGLSWNASLLEALGVGQERMPRVVSMGTPVGEVRFGSGVPLAAGTIDALADQIVTGATEPGDVLVIFGATLVAWVVVDSPVEVPGYWCVPHTVPERFLVGGPSVAGALFLSWVRGLLGIRPSVSVPAGPAKDKRKTPLDPARVPVWLPWAWGERAPLHDPRLQASIHGMDLSQGVGSLERAAMEASGFVLRRLCDAVEATGACRCSRIVASGGGSLDQGWMQAVADASALPVDIPEVSEGAALGAAFLARMAAGLEGPDLGGALSWARLSSRIEPAPGWVESTAARMQRFRELIEAQQG